MVLYNIKELEKLLLEGKVSDRLAFNYLFIHLILFTLTAYIPQVGNDAAWSTWVHLLISLVAIIWGVRRTFEINRNGDNKDYFKRFISLSFVAGIRTIVIGLIISLVLVVGTLIAEQFMASSAQFSLFKEVSELVAYALLNLVFFYILINSFKRINPIDASPAQVKTA